MPCSNYLCERYGQHREEWHEEEEPMEHGEKVIDEYLCQPCPECTAKLEAAKEMARALQIITEGPYWSKCQCNIKHGDNVNCPVLIAEAAFSAWEKAGKGLDI